MIFDTFKYHEDELLIKIPRLDINNIIQIPELFRSRNLILSIIGQINLKAFINNGLYFAF